MTPERIDQSPGVHMSERMTSDLDDFVDAYVADAVRDDATRLDRALMKITLKDFATKLRASQTPPQAVTREQIAPLIDKEAFAPLTPDMDYPRWINERALRQDNAERKSDAILALLAEKPAPTPLTLTEEERALAKEAATITDDDAELTARALRLLGAHNTADEIKKLVTAHGRLGRALERLSASPTAPPNIYTPGHDPFANVDAAINKAQGWRTGHLTQENER